MRSKKNKTRKVVSNTVACNNFTVNGAENIFERQSFVTESKPGVFLEGTICQLGGSATPAGLGQAFDFWLKGVCYFFLEI